MTLTDAGLACLESLAGGPAVEALESLPSAQREAVRARVIDDRPYGEIAAELACSESVVRQRVSRGVRAMRDRLSGAER